MKLIARFDSYCPGKLSGSAKQRTYIAKVDHILPGTFHAWYEAAKVVLFTTCFWF